MGQNSKIEWTDTTWNPLAGCTRASSGCDNCYAASMALRLAAMAEADLVAGKEPGGKRKYIGIAVRTPSGRAAFNGTINLDAAALNEPRTWKKPRRVFVNSMSDLFHKDVPDAFIRAAFAVMADTPRHTYQVLTKRPERMATWTQAHYADGLPPNIWCGTSVEDQATAEERIPHLLQVPARVRFLSCEPLLGPVDISWVGSTPGVQHRPNGLGKMGYQGGGARSTRLDASGLHWVIVGGESGPNARPMHPTWARSLRDQCANAGVAFFFKQWGEELPKGQGEHGLDERGLFRRESHVSGQTYYNIGKRAAGRLLDGAEHNEVPDGEGITP